ncbi:unnamed protein product, partial [marine sediment metagenome]
GDEHFGTEPPCTTYELRPVIDREGKKIKGLNTAWIILNNPQQYNSYTTEMVKGVIAGFHRASMDRTVLAAIFTGSRKKTSPWCRNWTHSQCRWNRAIHFCSDS